MNTSFLLVLPLRLPEDGLPTEGGPNGLKCPTMATYNPVTYLLEALRSLVSGGWDGAAIARGLASIAGWARSA